MIVEMFIQTSTYCAKNVKLTGVCFCKWWKYIGFLV